LGFDSEGRKTLSYIEGGFMHPGPWTLEGVAAVGQLLRDLHRATLQAARATLFIGGVIRPTALPGVAIDLDALLAES
jgi:hypothetical protein